MVKRAAAESLVHFVEVVPEDLCSTELLELMKLLVEDDQVGGAA